MGKLPDGTRGSGAADSPDSVGTGTENETATGDATNEGDGAEHGDTTGGDDGATGTRTAKPSDEREALRRQQRLVAAGIALLAGVALAASAVQQFPDRPLVFPVVSGILGAALVFWLASKGLAPVDGDEATKRQSDDAETDAVGPGDDAA